MAPHRRPCWKRRERGPARAALIDQLSSAWQNRARTRRMRVAFEMGLAPYPFLPVRSPPPTEPLDLVRTEMKLKQNYITVHENISSFANSTFSGFISRCIIPLLCKYETPRNKSRIINLIFVISIELLNKKINN